MVRGSRHRFSDHRDRAHVRSNAPRVGAALRRLLDRALAEHIAERDGRGKVDCSQPARARARFHTDRRERQIRPSERKGKVVLVNFWATWCGGCQVEIPWFKDLYNERKNAGLDAIGVSLDSDGWTSVLPYLKEKPISYTIVIGNEATANEFHVSAMPVTVLIDRQGKIAATHSGLVAKATYQAEIESLLK